MKIGFRSIATFVLINTLGGEIRLDPLSKQD